MKPNPVAECCVKMNVIQITPYFKSSTLFTTLIISLKIVSLFLQLKFVPASLFVSAKFFGTPKIFFWKFATKNCHFSNHFWFNQITSTYNQWGAMSLSFWHILNETPCRMSYCLLICIFHKNTTLIIL